MTSAASDSPRPPIGLTLQRYAEAKAIPMDRLREYGLSDQRLNGTPAVRIPYLNADGTEQAVKYRLSLDREPRFRWRKGDKVGLYGIDRLDSMSDFVVVVEGESDCHTLWHHDIPAVGVPGASGWQDHRDAARLEGIPTVFVVVEPDHGGTTMLNSLLGSPLKDSVAVVRMPPEAQDPSALYLADRGGFATTFEELLHHAEPAAVVEATRLSDLAATAWAECDQLAAKPRILDELGDLLAESGVAGEKKLAGLVYLAATSRLLGDVCSVVVKGPSSVGKSFVAHSVLSLFPPDALILITSMSDRALIYDEAESLRHRMIVIFEAAGVSSEFADYLIRTLISDGRIIYKVTEKQPDGHMATRTIIREGPCGLILTTTRPSLHPENETRMLSVNATDTPNQTRAVLRSIAAEDARALDVGQWHALQVWLQGGSREVTVPYAMALAEAVPPAAVRLRRDFKFVLSLTKTHALLHRASRHLDERGRIVATLEDYAVVRDLTHDIISEGVARAVPPTVRDTVQSVAELLDEDAGSSSVTIAQLARRLDLDQSAARRRCYVAIEEGYLINEAAPHKRMQLRLGDPMPEDQPVLPHPDDFPWVGETNVNSLDRAARLHDFWAGESKDRAIVHSIAEAAGNVMAEFPDAALAESVPSDSISFVPAPNGWWKAPGVYSDAHLVHQDVPDIAWCGRPIPANPELVLFDSPSPGPFCRVCSSTAKDHPIT